MVKRGTLSTSEKLASANPAVRREGSREVSKQSSSQAKKTIKRAGSITRRGFSGTASSVVVAAETAAIKQAAEVANVTAKAQAEAMVKSKQAQAKQAVAALKTTKFQQIQQQAQLEQLRVTRESAGKGFTRTTLEVPFKSAVKVSSVPRGFTAKTEFKEIDIPILRSGGVTRLAGTKEPVFFSRATQISSGKEFEIIEGKRKPLGEVKSIKGITRVRTLEPITNDLRFTPLTRKEKARKAELEKDTRGEFGSVALGGFETFSGIVKHKAEQITGDLFKGSKFFIEESIRLAPGVQQGIQLFESKGGKREKLPTFLQKETLDKRFAETTSPLIDFTIDQPLTAGAIAFGTAQVAAFELQKEVIKKPISTTLDISLAEGPSAVTKLSKIAKTVVSPKFRRVKTSPLGEKLITRIPTEAEFIEIGLIPEGSGAAPTIKPKKIVKQSDIPFREDPSLPKFTQEEQFVIKVAKQDDLPFAGSVTQEALLKKQFTRKRGDLDLLSPDPELTTLKIIEEAKKGGVELKAKKVKIKTPEAEFDIFRVETSKGKLVVDVDPIKFAEEGLIKKGTEFVKVEGVSLVPPEIRLQSKATQLARGKKFGSEKVIGDIKQLSAGKFDLDSPLFRGGFGFTQAEQAAFVGVEGPITTSARGLFTSAKPITITGEGLFATPPLSRTRGGTRVSRLGISRREATLKDIFSGDFTTGKGDPQIVFFKGKVGDDFAPFGRAGTSELETLLPPDKVIVRKGVRAKTLLKGKGGTFFDLTPVPIIEGEIVKVPVGVSKESFLKSTKQIEIPFESTSDLKPFLPISKPAKLTAFRKQKGVSKETKTTTLKTEFFSSPKITTTRLKTSKQVVPKPSKPFLSPPVKPKKSLPLPRKGSQTLPLFPGSSGGISSFDISKPLIPVSQPLTPPPTSKKIIPIKSPPPPKKVPGFDITTKKRKQRKQKRPKRPRSPKSRFAPSLLGVERFERFGETLSSAPDFVSGIGIRSPIRAKKGKKKGKKKKGKTLLDLVTL